MKFFAVACLLFVSVGCQPPLADDSDVFLAPEIDLSAASKQDAPVYPHAQVRVAHLARVKANDGGPWDYIYINVVVRRDHVRAESLRRPAKTWKFDSMMNRKDSQDLNALIWEGDVAEGEYVTVSMKVWEQDGGSPDDQLGHVYAAIRNVGGKIDYKFTPQGGDTKYYGQSKADDYGFRMTGDGSKYFIYLKNWYPKTTD